MVTGRLTLLALVARAELLPLVALLLPLPPLLPIVLRERTLTAVAAVVELTVPAQAVLTATLLLQVAQDQEVQGQEWTRRCWAGWPSWTSLS